LLRDNGYPHATVQVVNQSTGSRHLAVIFDADRGLKSYFSEIGITGLHSVGERVVRRELTFRPGDLYRASEVTKSQQRLLELGLFQFAHIGPASTEPDQTQR
jgi:outer membrane protein insertion porin family